VAETRPLAKRTRVKQGRNEDFRLPQPKASMETKEAQGQKENTDVSEKNILLECQWNVVML